MAATITVTCPECDTSIKASAEVEGKKVRCKSCGEVFVATPATAGGKSVTAKPAAKAPKPAAKAAAKPAKEEAMQAQKPASDDEDDDGTPYGLTSEDLTHRCPHCANELESADAKICLHCGYQTDTREQKRTRKVVEQTGGDVFMWLLPGIACAMGVVAGVVWDIVYCLNIEDWIDADTWYGGLLASGAIKMWMCIISVFIMYGLGRFAVHRLIFDRIPPEVEKK